MPKIDIRGFPHVYDFTQKSDQVTVPVLVFIHGWLLSKSYWQPLIELLSPWYPCLSYDLRGFGDSQLSAGDKIQQNYTLESYAQDIGQLLAQLNIEQAWLIGHSLGGNIAIWGAKSCPERVNGVICLNSGGGIYLKEEFERFRNAGAKIVKLRPRWLAYLPLVDLLFARTMVAQPLSRYWGRRRLLDFLRADEEAALATLMDSTTETEVHLLPQIVANLQQPVYFLAGAEDKIMEPKYVQHLASFHQLFEVNGGNVLTIPACGHLGMIEQPHVVSEYILSLIKSSKNLDLCEDKGGTD
ncbi:alpha/beta fold hydrolase [Gloeocapsa sp. PCC 73106]|uniref:alpha/beta fold hydrolase n=1 Tax=Gloeocapsa sp. PCC 73106 TaxID=102232 RepID=UPI0002AC3618|nr:alpha/beta hydrolase [Gloeocapsa sp. PCC 73106]ELR98169.1 putative hydrolase or acyltransferase of alpha/beta superfamily [Gloeocapsa sp. PCC 73106]